MTMSIFRQLPRLIAVSLSLAVSIGSFAAERFNFSYRSSGESDLRPTQVFDDGERTYFQMRGSVVPVFFVNADGRQVMLRVSRSGEFLVVDAVSNELTLKYAALTVRITNTGKPNSKTILGPRAEAEAPSGNVPPNAAAVAPLPSVQPTTYGATKPLVGDYVADSPFTDKVSLVPFKKGATTLSKEAAAKILVALAGQGAPVKVVITGRDDQAYVEGMALARGIAIRDRVLAAGVPLEKITIKEGIARDSENNFVTSDLVVVWKNASEVTNRPSVATASQITPSQSLSSSSINEAHGKWEMQKSDGTISAMLARWAASEGWTLVWTAPASSDPKITGEATIVADDFADAVKLVITQSAKLGYPLTHTIKNKVLTIK